MGNNYDCNKDHVNIEVTAYQDADSSRIYYEESFETIEDGRNMPSLLIYTQGDTTLHPDSLSALTEIDYKATLRRDLLVAVLDENDGMTNSFYSRKELRSLNKDELTVMVQDMFNDGHDFDEVCNLASRWNIAIVANGYTKITSRGYSQGDCIDVLVPDELIEKSWLRDAIDNLLWDAPMSLNINIEGFDEIREDELLVDYYKYDRGEIMEAIEKIIGDVDDKEYILETVDELLPENPEYI